jgi:hypothetical protein
VQSLDGSGLAAAGFEVADVPRFAPGNRIVASLWMLCGLPEAESRSSSLLTAELGGRGTSIAE